MTLGAKAATVARAAFGRLPAPTRRRLRSRLDDFRGLGQVKRNHATLARRVAELERAIGIGAPPAPRHSDPRFPPGLRSRACTQVQLSEPWFLSWCEALGERPRFNRKLWERAYIIHTLDCLEMLRPGRRGVGFGVGREPLVAFFAGRGCEVVATDLPSTANEWRLWSGANQYGGLDDLRRPGLCPEDRFGELVTVRRVDMRSVPPDLGGFDFCWSACALEHLGSLEAGMNFVQQSMRTLVPGGVAVHTTELNMTSDDATISSGPTVVYRRRDLEALARELEAAGHQVAALDLEPGAGVLDEYVDVPPYNPEPHVKIWLDEYTITSVALVVRAGG